MWILHFLPSDFILLFTNALLIIGILFVIAGLVAHRIPLIWKYQLPFKLIGLVLFAAGIFFRGGYSVEMDWRERVAEVERQLEQAKKESAKVNTVIQEKVVTRVQVVKEKADTLIQYVDREVIKEVDNCRLSPEAIEVHNEAAELNKIVEQQRKQQK